jgi:alpha-1,3-rhamnosyl/mannosyltransferase
MRILIDASPTLLRSAGIKTYLWHWIRSLRELAPDEIRAFPFLKDLGELDHFNSNRSAFVTYPRVAALLALRWRANPMLDWLGRSCQVFHASNQIWYPPRGCRLTATVHDATSYLMPETHLPANIAADRRFTANMLKNAAGLIAVSENTRRDAIRVMGLDERRIRTIYSGVDSRYFDAAPLAAGSLGLTKPYVLSVGTIEPRKNLDVLLDAWTMLRQDLRQQFDLVIAGPAGWSSESTLARIRNEARYIGYVPEDQLPGLTAGATALAYPSLYEGFGFPVAQAMAARVPVVTSFTSCLPEIAGDGAIYVDPRSPAELSRALLRLLESEELRRRLARAGRERAQRYQWRDCAQQSLEFFREIATG